MEDVLWNISYANFVMDLATIPTFETETMPTEEGDDEIIEINSPEEMEAYLRNR